MKLPGESLHLDTSVERLAGLISGHSWSNPLIFLAIFAFGIGEFMGLVLGIGWAFFLILPLVICGSMICVDAIWQNRNNARLYVFGLVYVGSAFVLALLINLIRSV